MPDPHALAAQWLRKTASQRWVVYLFSDTGKTLFEKTFRARNERDAEAKGLKLVKPHINRHDDAEDWVVEPASSKHGSNANSLREQLAALEHEQWAHWTEYMLGVVEKLFKDESFEKIPEVRRWRKQIDTPYAELTEEEKDSDRFWADKVLDITGNIG